MKITNEQIRGTMHRSGLKGNDPRRKDYYIMVVKVDICSFKLIQAPDRAELQMSSIPFGFYLTAFGGENQYTVLHTPNQDRTTSLVVCGSACNSDIIVRRGKCKWEDEAIFISHLLNLVYFHKG